MDMRVNSVEWRIVERDAFGRVTNMSTWQGERPAGAPRHVILVPVDGSPASVDAVHVAAQMADPVPNAELHLLNVRICCGNSAGDDSFEFAGLLETEAARAALDRMGQAYKLTLLSGSPADAILSHARDVEAAEIVMGSHGAGRLERLLVGSVAMDVAERACVPVTLVKTNDHSGRLPNAWVDWLVPCDGSGNSLRAVRYVAKRLAGSANKPLVHLLNVQESDAPHPDPARAAAARRFMEIDHRGRARFLCRRAAVALEAARIPHDFHVRVGAPAVEIAAAAERLGCGHVAMGTRGLGLLGKLVLGSVSSDVARRIHVPLTLIA